MKTPSLAKNGAERPTKGKISQHVVEAQRDISDASDPIVKFSVDIPDSLHRALKAKALEQRQTIKQIIRELLTEYTKQ